jgi:hypothetical protein
MGYDMRMVRTPEGASGDYRYNNWGMSITRGFMEHWAGATYPAQRPAFPELATERAQVTDRETIVDGRVASYKWESNDGWLVTPAECRIIAERVRKSADMIAREFFTDIDGMTEEQGRAWVTGWIRFHELAAEHGGYRVY